MRSSLKSRIENRASFRTYFKHWLSICQTAAKRTLALMAQPLAWLQFKLAGRLIQVSQRKYSDAKSRKTGNRVKVLFAPYPYPPTKVLHSILAAGVLHSGHQAELSSTRKLIVLAEVSYRNLEKVGDRKFQSFAEIIVFLHSLGSGDEILSTAIIDEFVRYCPVSVFTGDYIVSRQFQLSVLKAQQEASAWAGAHDVVVLGDSSYLANGAIISGFLKKGRKVFIADFPGTFREVTKTKSERRNRDSFYSELEKLRCGETSAVGPDPGLEKFFAQRYSGRSADHEIAKAFGLRNHSSFSPSAMKKVLFLHSFRDANGQVSSPELGSSLFRTYFEWADAALAIVAEQPEDWIVKPHPGMGRLIGDSEILSFLLEKHSIPRQIVADDMSAAFVLEHRWPIFTHDGSVAREAPTFGYRAVSISVHLPEEITLRLKTMAEFRSCYRLPPIDVNSEVLDPLIVRAAKKMFFEYASPRFKVVLRKPRQRTGRSHFSNQLLPARISFTLARKSTTRAGSEEIRGAVRDLIQPVSSPKS